MLPVRVLHVKILSAQCPLARNSYVQVKMIDLTNGSSRCVRTQTLTGTSAPLFDEQFFLAVHRMHKLSFQLLDEGFHYTFLGKSDMFLHDVPTESDGAAIAPKTLKLEARRSSEALTGDASLKVYIAFARMPSDIPPSSGHLQVEQGPVKPMTRLSQEFQVKVALFRERLPKPGCTWGKNMLSVRRAYLVEDSMVHLGDLRSTDALREELWIMFRDETDFQNGGLVREWFDLISTQLLAPGYGLFLHSDSNAGLQINPHSGKRHEHHLQLFFFLGRFAGLAVYHRCLLAGSFSRPFYKSLLQRSFVMEDVKTVDKRYYESLCYIRDNDPLELGLSFSVDDLQPNGEVLLHNLLPGGDNIAVTNTNKLLYLSLLVEWKYVTRISQQMDAFKCGFSSLVPVNTLRAFTEHEMELLMCGLQRINLRDWRENTLYEGGYHAGHPTVKLFWETVDAFGEPMRVRLLQFVTGCSRIPMNGFQSLYGSNSLQKFVVVKWGAVNRFPRALTCFNRLELPPYCTLDEMSTRLTIALQECQGFGEDY